MTSRLTIITGPVGVDIGPVAALLGRQLADGLAIRVVHSDVKELTPHTSPDPFHRITGDATHHAGAVRLEVLPSAWQDPDTNLGVCYTGHADEGLTEDLHTMDALGLNPAHRVTVQHRPAGVSPMSILDPVDIGNLGVIARDSVLRTGGRVQIEAGDGQTFLSALSVVGIPPWADWIGHLDRWIVLDANTHNDTAGTLIAIRDAVNDLDGSSGTYSNPHPLAEQGRDTLRIALFNGQVLIPGLAGCDYNVATDKGDTLPGDIVDQFVALLDRIASATGVEAHLIGTGRLAGTGASSWIDSGDWA